MSPYELLTQAQNLIRYPNNWTQGTYARDRDGLIELPYSEQATCFCSLGALQRVMPNRRDPYHEASEYLIKVIQSHGREIVSIPDFNDTHTHAEVMAVWDKARELAQA